MTNKFESEQLEIGGDITKSHTDDEGNEVIDEIELDEISLEEPAEEFGEPSSHDTALTEAFNDGFKQCMEQLGLKEMPKYRVGQSVCIVKKAERIYPYLKNCTIEHISIYNNDDQIYYSFDTVIGCYSEGETHGTHEEAEKALQEEIIKSHTTKLQKKLGSERYEKAKKEKMPTIQGIPADELDKEDLIVAMQLNGVSVEVN